MWNNELISRREMLKSSALGFGSLALMGLLSEQAGAAQGKSLVARPPQFPASSVLKNPAFRSLVV